MADYISKYPNGEAVDAALDLASTAVQKVEGKDLSTNDYTNAEKQKLASLSNYDDSDLKDDISWLKEYKQNNLTEAQQNAVNSGIDSSKVEQIITNANDISNLKNTKANSSDVYTKSQVDTAVNAKANSADVYTKSEMDTALSAKANSSNVYTKSEMDTALSAKANSSNVYTKSEVDTALSAKANSSNVYTKSEMDTALSAKATTADLTAETERAETAESSLKSDVALNRQTLGYTKKNLLKIKSGTYTAGTSTFTINSDGSVHYISTDASTHTVNLGTMKLNAGKYTMSGREGSRGDIRLIEVGTGKSITTSNPVTFEIASDTEVTIRAYTWSNNANETIYPMLRSADIEDDTFEPYVPDVDEKIGQLWNVGSKNLLKITATSQTISGVTFTVNSDGSVTANGTATNDAYLNVLSTHKLSEYIIDGERFILSGCPSGGSKTTYFMNTGYTADNVYDVGNEKLFTSNSGILSHSIYIGIMKNQTANNLTFRPMLRSADITDDTFVPYAPTNRELYEMIEELTAEIEALKNGE